MGDNQKCHVKIPILRKQSFVIKKAIPDIGQVHYNNSYIPEDIVLKHTSAKFDLVICKNEVNTPNTPNIFTDPKGSKEKYNLHYG